MGKRNFLKIGVVFLRPRAIRWVTLSLVMSLSSMVPVEPMAYAQASGEIATRLPAKVSKKESTKKRVAPKKTIRKKVSPKRSAKKAKTNSATSKKVAEKTSIPRSSITQETAESPELHNALDLAKKGNYSEASMQLFNLSRSPRFVGQKMQIKYLLGLMLFDMKMYQTAAFQFVDVVRDGSSIYIKKSLEKLSIAADKLGDETLLNYALSKVQLSDFPAESRDMLRFRIGEFQFKNGQYQSAVNSFSAVNSGTGLYGKAKYMEGLSYASQDKNESAIRAFKELLNSRDEKAVTDTTRVSALMALARTYYQNKNWEEGTAYYRMVPRDTDFWHEALFEISWAQFRNAQFRSVLSNMQSLHSPYYEDYYLPESLMLRSLVYLYICQYDEMEKTLELFKKTYVPVRRTLVDVIKSFRTPYKYFEEMDRTISKMDRYKGNPQYRKELGIPFIVVRKIMGEADFSQGYEYIKLLNDEKNLIEKQDSKWRTSALGMYAKKVLATRISRARDSVGVIVKKHISSIHKDLLDLSKQHDFARFEMLNGQKDQAKKEILATDKSSRVDEDSDRSFYIQNGYEYWPFQGEYWLDEIGNYYYLGKPRCE